jgi:hypothetical protein
MARRATVVTILFEVETRRGSVFQRVDTLAAGIWQEHRIGDDDVPVDVQIEARAKALAKGHGCSFRLFVAKRSGVLALPELISWTKIRPMAESASGLAPSSRRSSND